MSAKRKPRVTTPAPKASAPTPCRTVGELMKFLKTLPQKTEVICSDESPGVLPVVYNMGRGCDRLYFEPTHNDFLFEGEP